MARSRAWEAVAEAYTTDIADQLRRRDWEGLTAATTREWVEAIRSNQWDEVGDGEHGAMEGAYLIRAALMGSITSDDAVLDAIRTGNDAQLGSVGRINAAQRSSFVTGDGDRRVGLK